MWSGSEEGSYVRLMDFVSVNSRLKSKKEEEDSPQVTSPARIVTHDEADWLPLKSFQG